MKRRRFGKTKDEEDATGEKWKKKKCSEKHLELSFELFAKDFSSMMCTKVLESIEKLTAINRCYCMFIFVKLATERHLVEIISNESCVKVKNDAHIELIQKFRHIKRRNGKKKYWAHQILSCIKQSNCAAFTFQWFLWCTHYGDS